MMSDVRMRFSLAAISLIAIALGSFVATKALIDDSDVTAEGPPNDPAAIRQAVANDAALARFDGTLSGIRVAPGLDVRDATTLCVGTDDVQSFDIDDPRASELPVVPSNLPLSAEFLSGIAVVCRGQLASVEAEWFVPRTRCPASKGGTYRCIGSRASLDSGRTIP